MTLAIADVPLFARPFYFTRHGESTHSGVFRVLCRTLGLNEPDAPYRNAQPVRFEPPAEPGSGWRRESL
ncbi:MAG: hypothetical protein ABI547_06270 [Betaproteobacteria bacterium]